MKHLLLSSLLFLAAATTATFAQNSGTAGSLQWEYTPADSTLTISGSGEIPDYGSGSSNAAPWYHLRQSIKSVIIEYGVTKIQGYAFNGCSSLTAVSLPNSLNTIAGQAFYRCNSLTEINIPRSVTLFNVYAIRSCPSLAAVTVADSSSSYSSENGVLFNKSKTVLRYYPTAKPEATYAIPNSVMQISQSAFDYCAFLKTVIIPASVTTFNYQAFDNCSLLRTVINQAKTPQTIDTNLFATINQSASTLYVPGDSIELYRTARYWKDFGSILAYSGDTNSIHWEYTAADSTLTISGSGAMPNFKTSNGISSAPWGHFTKLIKSLVVEPGVTSIGDYAFSYCSLTAASIPEGVTIIGIGAFIRSSLTEIFLPESLTTIKANAIQSCSSLTSITVAAGNPNYSSENGVLFNGDKTMLVQYPIGSTKTIYDIPGSVTSIFANAFLDGKYLAAVIIPGSVATINVHAFNGCTSLKEVINHAETPQTISATVFQSAMRLDSCTLRVPSASVALYQAADVWKNFGSIKAIALVTGVTLDRSELSLKVDSFSTLVATVAPDDALNDDVVWSSSSPAVATVDDAGLVRAVTVGEALIIVTTSEGGFTDTCEVTVVDGGSVGISVAEALPDDALRIYPNPVGNELNIDGGALSGGLSGDLRGALKVEKIEILNLSGKIVLVLNGGGAAAGGRINVSALASGIYFLKAKTPAGVITKKFVKR